MKGRDYLWCVLNMMLDDEQALERLCPSCRMEADRGGCPVCGAATGEQGGAVNTGFDLGRFEALKRGETLDQLP